MFYFLEQTTSTNDDAREAKYVHGDLICAEHQSAGRGQRGHAWSSEDGKNIIFSIVLEPKFLAVGKQFLIAECVALALTDTLATYGIEAKIKWTNDIYVGDKKITGVLIEHNYSGSTLSRTIVGIGINVNQDRFDPSLPNPVSMKQLSGVNYERYNVMQTLYDNLMRRYAQLESGDEDALQADYHHAMYRLKQQHPFRRPDGSITMAAIQGVKPSGELILLHDDGSTATYLFKEIEFVIDKLTKTI